MSTAVSPDHLLRQRLRDTQQVIASKRRELAEARRASASARDAFTAVEVPPEKARESPAYQALMAAAADERRITSELEAIVGVERDLLGVMSGEGGQIDPASGHVGRVDSSTPGAWLSLVAASGSGDVGGMTTADGFGSRTDIGLPLIDRLAVASAVMASGPTVVDIDTTDIKIPRLSGRLEPAPIVGELEPIPESEVPLDHVVAAPPKIPALTTLSEEAFRDARPAVLAANERELVRSVAGGFDVVAFEGVPGSDAFTGLLATTGTAAIDAEGTLEDLDPFVDAIAALRASGASATAIYLHPLTWARLCRIKKSADSAEPLVSARLVTEGPRESILGVPVYQSEYMPEHTAVVAMASELLVVRRSRIEIRVAENYRFAEAGVGIRVIYRAALAIPQPAAVALVENLPAPGSGSGS